MDQKLVQIIRNGSGMDQKWIRNGSEIDQKWDQISEMSQESEMSKAHIIREIGQKRMGNGCRLSEMGLNPQKWI